MPSKGGGSSSSSAPALKALFYNDDYGLENATATAVSAHLASQGCTRPAHLCDVDDDDVAEMVTTLALLKYPSKRSARIINAARETGACSSSGGAEHGHLNSPGPGLKDSGSRMLRWQYCDSSVLQLRKNSRCVIYIKSSARICCTWLTLDVYSALPLHPRNSCY